LLGCIPEKELFPVLDLFRVSVCSEIVAKLFIRDESSILTKTLDLMARWKDLSNPTQVMIVRIWCNLFPMNSTQSDIGVKFILENEKIFDLLIKLIAKGLQPDAAAPLRYTISCLVNNLSQFIENENGDNEVQFAVTLIESLKNSLSFEEDTNDQLVMALSRLVKIQTFHDLLSVLDLKLETIKVGNKLDLLKDLIKKQLN
jgi:hypothetical protein